MYDTREPQVNAPLNAFFAICKYHSLMDFVYVCLLLMFWWRILILFWPGVVKHGAPHQGFSFFFVITLSPGLVNTNMLFFVPRWSWISLCSQCRCWIGLVSYLILELQCPLFCATVVVCDNVSSVYLASNHVQHQRTKHMKLDLHFVRKHIAIGHVRIFRVPSAHHFLDIFTKRLSTQLLLDFRSILSIHDSPTPTRGCGLNN